MEFLKGSKREFVYMVILSLAVFLAPLPFEFKENLNDGLYRRLLPSDDTIPNTLLPFVIFKGDGFDFNPVMKSGLIHRGAPGYLPYYFVERSGKILSVYPVLSGLMAFPIYLVPLLLGKVPELTYHENILRLLSLGRIAASFYAALSVGLFYLIIDRYEGSNKKKLLFTAFYALGTATFSISSRGVWQHTFSQFFYSLILLLLVNRTLFDKYGYLTGLFLGCAVLVRVTNIIFALVVSLYFFVYHRDKFMKFVLAAIPTVVLLLIYNYSTFGAFLVEGYAARGYGVTDLQHWSTPLYKGLSGFFVSPGRGVLFTSPPLLLGYYFIVRLFTGGAGNFKRKTLYLYLSVAFIVSLLLLSKWFTWHGANAFGQRMLSDYLPFIGLFSFLVFKDLQKPVVVVFTLLMLYSVYVHANAVIFRKSRCGLDDTWNFKCLEPGVHL